MKFLKSVINFFKVKNDFFYHHEQLNYERQMQTVKTTYRKAG